MRYNQPGRTGLFVSQMRLGTMNFGTNLGKYAAAGGLELSAADRSQAGGYFSAADNRGCLASMRVARKR